MLFHGFSPLVKRDEGAKYVRNGISMIRMLIIVMFSDYCVNRLTANIMPQRRRELALAILLVYTRHQYQRALDKS